MDRRLYDKVAVSIHALLAECDFRGSTWESTSARFNPRTPCGVRRISGFSDNAPLKFQSTHSLRSATEAIRHLGLKDEVSIHALLAECDPGAVSCGFRLPGFNPRTPCGVRPALAVLGERDFLFQSTHSLRSATHMELGHDAALGVSIHALLAECDRIGVDDWMIPTGFNPRTPCGVRLGNGGSFPLVSRFQSTHSLRSATADLVSTCIPEQVSIHALLAECDKKKAIWCRSFCCFNPRTPCGVRLYACK